MRKSYNALFIFLILCVFIGQAFAETIIKGTVSDEQDGPLPGANVVVEGKFIGTSTDVDGIFILKTDLAPPFNLQVSMVGFSTQTIEITEAETTLDIVLKEESFLSDAVVVSASRVEESFMRAPVSVEKIDQLALKQSPSATFFDGLADLREVNLIANSMIFKGATGRGFGDMHNTGLIQLIDGVDNAGIANGSFALGNMVGISDIDVADVEFLPGASSALYGPNAFSGVLFINSKSPFDYQGLSIEAKSGMSSSEYAGSAPLYGINLRYAKAMDRFAYKIALSHFQARDWVAHNFADKEGKPANAPDFNGVNIYGDEVATTLNLDDLAGLPAGTLGSIRVGRTGYKEEDLYDYDPARSTKMNIGLRYRLTDDLEAAYDYRIGTGRSIYQGTNRYALDNLLVQYHKLELKGSNFFVRAYNQSEDAGDSHDIVFTGWNVNRQWKSDTQWFTDYATTFIGANLPTAYGGLGLSADQAHALARQQADVGRLEPGTAEFEAAVKKVKSTKDFRVGSGFTSKSGFTSFEGMYDLSGMIPLIDLQVGGNYRNYGVNTEGTIYSDATDPISIYEYGVYAQASAEVIEEKLRVTGSLRLDGHKNFEDHISPRIAAVYTPVPDHNFRASYQSGFNNPIIESQYINLNLGAAVLLGGTQDNMDRTGLGYIYQNGIDKNTLQPVTTPFREPEFQQTFEFGYKALIDDHLFIDASYYNSNYTNRFKGVTVLDPVLLSQGEILPYVLYTNEKDKNIVLQGAGLGLKYHFDNGYNVGLNYTFTERSGGDDDDVLNSLNRAKHNVKFSVGNSRVTENLGFRLSARWRSKFTWIATFVPAGGEVGGETVVDGQVSYRVPSLKSTIKAGVNNLLNQSYTQAYGSVDIGTMFYLSITYDSLFY